MRQWPYQILGKGIFHIKLRLVNSVRKTFAARLGLPLYWDTHRSPKTQYLEPDIYSGNINASISHPRVPEIWTFTVHDTGTRHC